MKRAESLAWKAAGRGFLEANKYGVNYNKLILSAPKGILALRLSIQGFLLF